MKINSTQAAANRLGEAGNVTGASTNTANARTANQGNQLDERLSSSAVPIDGMLDRGAQRLAAGDNPNDANYEAYREIRDYLKAQLDQLTGAVGKGDRLDSVGINRREVVNERVIQERSSEPS